MGQIDLDSHNAERLRLYKSAPKWSPREMSQKALQRFRDGSVVNLGTGMPMEILRLSKTELSRYFFHSENGVVGIGKISAKADEIDLEVMSAGKHFVSLREGASFFDHTTSFGLVRGGHIDGAVLGAYQVSRGGDLANWRRPDDTYGSVGGAMDIAASIPNVVVMMSHVAKDGSAKIVAELSYPATAMGCVKWIVTDMAVVRVDDLTVTDHVEGVTVEVLSDLSNVSLSAGGVDGYSASRGGKGRAGRGGQGRKGPWPSAGEVSDRGR